MLSRHLHLPLSLLFPLALILLPRSSATNIILPLPLNNNNNNNNNTTTPQPLTPYLLHNCVPSPDWNPPTRHIASACETALLSLSDELPHWGPHLGHFTYNPRTNRSSARFPGAAKVLALPKRYVSGQCVVAVVMMRMFEAGGLRVPGLPMGVWPVEDEVGWSEVVLGGEYVRAACKNGCGYAVVGVGRGLLVAVWGVNSMWDRFVRGMGVGGGG